MKLRVSLASIAIIGLVIIADAQGGGAPRDDEDSDGESGSGIPEGDTEVRLVGGATPNIGRVEVLHAGEWGTICDRNWDFNDAMVVCVMLGYRGASLAPGGARYGAADSDVKIWLDDVACFGSEHNIDECFHRGWGVHNCAHTNDASAVCVTY